VSLKKALIVPDCHRPFHSRKAYNLMLEVASFHGIDEIVILGDYADFWTVSFHEQSKDPRLPKLLMEEVESVNLGLDELDRLFPQANKVFLEGNHEYRLERYVQAKAPALFGVTECTNLFQIPLRKKWRYRSYGKGQPYRVLGTSLLAKHTPLASSPMTGLRKAAQSYCYGHNHRIEECHVVGLDGASHVAFSPGWLGDERLKAFGYMVDQPNWQLGFAIVYSSSPKEFHHEIVKIKSGYTCVSAGRLFKA
jgi:hypothetical protein